MDSIIYEETSQIPWWLILIIVISCIGLSITLAISMYYGVKHYHNKQAENNVARNKQKILSF